MDDYSIIRDLLETWRSTSDWIKAVILIAIPGYAALFTWLVLDYRTDMRTMLSEDTLNDERVRSLARAELCRLAAEWERARKAKNEAAAKLTDLTRKQFEIRWPP